MILGACSRIVGDRVDFGGVCRVASVVDRGGRRRRVGECQD